VARHLSPELDRVVMRGLERNPTQRYATAREMALDLERSIATAPTSEVGAWVDSLAHEELADRATQVAQIESQSSPTLTSGLLPSAPEPPEMRSDVSSIAVVPFSGSPPRRASGRHGFAASAMAAASLVILVFAILLLHDQRTAPTTAGATAATTATPPPATSETPPTPPVTAAPSAFVVSMPATDLPIVAPPPTAAPAATVPPAPRRRAPTPRPTPTATSAACDPPYWIDENGHTRYKPACL
jgi:serine/threonine-protein kinase